MGASAYAHPEGLVEGDLAGYRLKGLSLRAVARELGIARDTVRKYAYAEQSPTKEAQRPGTGQAVGATQIPSRSQ